MSRTSRARSSWLGLVTLLRPPNVFTAFADPLAGVIIAAGVGGDVSASAGLVVAGSGCLYLAGIVFNDVFDRHVDARERPNRPLPSGAVPVRAAVLLGTVLMAAGVGCAAAAGPAPAVIAGVLAAAILLYDGAAKSTAVGPVVMGCCRSLNMALGLSTGLGLHQRWPVVAVTGALLLGLYVTTLTFLARDEVGGNTVRRARAGLVAMAVLAGGAALGVLCAPGLPVSPWAWPWIALLLVLGVRNWAPVWGCPDGPTTRRAVGGGIVVIPVLDAAICAVAGQPLWALAVASLTVPAVVLKRYFSPT